LCRAIEVVQRRCGAVGAQQVDLAAKKITSTEFVKNFIDLLGAI
jgi:hypothetical protein